MCLAVVLEFLNFLVSIARMPQKLVLGGGGGVDVKMFCQGLKNNSLIIVFITF